MTTLGSAGKNRNFAPAFTVPAGMTLESYTRDIDQSGAPRYRMVRVRFDSVFPTAKRAAVLAAVSAAVTGARGAVRGSSYTGAGPTYRWLDIEYGGRAVTGYGKAPTATAAQVTTTLANAYTAATT